MNPFRLLRCRGLAAMLWCASATVSAAAAESVPSAPGDPVDATAIDALLKSYTAAQIFSGEVLVARGDQVLLHERYGYRDWSTREALPENGSFKVGSVTKQFTAAAILQLEQRGVLATSDPLRKHIPELPAALTARDGVDVTIHHLVTHTAGFPNPFYANFWGAERDFSTLLKALAGEQLRHTPGSEFHYNNTGYAVLGEIIRRTSKKTYEQFVRSELFEPSAMRGSGIKPQPEQRDRMVTGHVKNTLAIVPTRAAFGRFATGSYDWDLLANGNVFSTVSDLHRWVRRLQDGALFPPVAMDKMLTPGLHGYGYGWLQKTVEGWDEPLYWHNGAIIPFGFTADVAWTRNSKLCVIILSNLDDSAVASNVFDNVLRLIRRVPTEAPKAGFAVSGSYLTIQILALALGTPLAALLFAVYLCWALLLKSQRSRVDAYSTVAGAICLGVFIAVVLDRWAGAAGLVLALAFSSWCIWRTRTRPLLHATAWKQWLMTAGNLLSSAVVLALAVLIAVYF